MSASPTSFSARFAPSANEERSFADNVNNGRDILGSLHTLQTNHRLAIHIWENVGGSNSNPYNFPNFSLNSFLKPRDSAPITDPYGMAAGFAKGFNGAYNGLPLLSMSLLPATPDAATSLAFYSMLPFGTHTDRFYDAGYLVDLDQSDPATSAKVVRVHQSNLGTGSSADAKDLMLDFPTRLPPELLPADYYSKEADPEERSCDAWLKKFADPARASALTTEQLDALGKAYENNDWASGQTLLCSQPENIVKHNEIVVAAAVPHIKAIVVPWLADSYASPLYGDLVTLRGALAGLQHIREKGMDLPVVMYHVTPRNGESQNQFSLIGKGKEQLTEVAIHAIKNIRGFLKDVPSTHLEYLQAPMLNDAIQRDVGLAINDALTAPEKQFQLAAATLRNELQASILPS